ncbi:hypothetical protein HK098_003108 [Nowakowskiella sp. JEL0407]|nr:hypothetical protein HK098_003108 [Nowakowskiella sp. JEL0407]
MISKRLLFTLTLALLLNSAASQLTTCQKSIVQQLTNVYENSRFPFAFDYCSNIKDGRGYTSGMVGFTTATHDAIQVIDIYRASSSNATEFDALYPTIQRINATGSSSVSGLDGYCDAWKSASTKLEFRTAQIQLTDKLYFNPSQALADALGLRTPLARGQLYDAFIQHGGESDYDSAPSMVKRTTATTPKQGGSEQTWLTSFLSVRKYTLQHASTPETRTAWAQSVTRVNSYSYAVTKSEFDFESELRALDNDGKETVVPCNLNLWTEFVPVEVDDAKKRLSSGAIAGIVIAISVVLGVAGYVAWMYFRKRGFFAPKPPFYGGNQSGDLEFERIVYTSSEQYRSSA